MARKVEIVTFGGQGSGDGIRMWEDDTDTSQAFRVIMHTDGYCDINVTANEHDVYVARLDKLVSYLNTDADDVSGKKGTKFRIPANSMRTFTFTASLSMGGFTTHFALTAPRTANAKKTAIAVTVI